MRRGLVAAALWGLGAAAAQAQPLVIPDLGIEARDGAIGIVATARSEVATTITGTLEIRRSGAAGTATTRQAATLELVPGEPGTFATLELSLASGDRLNLSFALEAGGVTLAETTLVLGPPAP